jgi:3-polyprenyl-4-hydroxybenzoate decarboxylase
MTSWLWKKGQLKNYNNVNLFNALVHNPLKAYYFEQKTVNEIRSKMNNSFDKDMGQ